MGQSSLVFGILLSLYLVIRVYYIYKGKRPVPETSIALWIMIEINDQFLSKNEYKIEDKIEKLVTKKRLGQLDGHSSGGHQFDINLFNVQNFEFAKSEISKLLETKYPNLKFEISDKYETIFERDE